MVTLRVGGLVEPAMARAAAVFQTTASGLGVRLHPALSRGVRFSHDAAHLVSAFLSPAAALALVFGLWRLSVDLAWTSNFPIADGFFSHWIVWIALAIGLKLTSSLLARPDKERSASLI